MAADADFVLMHLSHLSTGHEMCSCLHKYISESGKKVETKADGESSSCDSYNNELDPWNLF